jgi:aspartate carbamoyltransferase catalytic subunit
MRDLIRVEDLSREEIEGVLDLAREMEVLREMGSDLCKGRILATMFYEPSTRTRLSFESAMSRLGGSVLGFADPQATSFVKEETLADTVHMVCTYADLIAIRHPRAGAARLAAEHSSVPVINAGDDAHEHPTQTLTDLYTLRQLKGRLSGLAVGICGDLRYGRAAHSLAYGLAMFGARIVLIAPPGLEMPDEVLWRLTHRHHAAFECVAAPQDAVADLDVLYVNRLQKERLPADLDPEAVRRIASTYRVNGELMARARADCLILHPLPRVDELARELDDDPRAAYFRQSANGVPVRMALMSLLLRRVQRPGFAEKRVATHDIGQGCANPSCVARHEPRVRTLAEPLDAQTGLFACSYCGRFLTRASET